MRMRIQMRMGIHYGFLKACELRSRVGENQIELAMLPATSTRCTGRLPGLAGGLA